MNGANESAASPAAPAALHPLVQRLVQACGAPIVTARGWDDYVASQREHVVFFTGDPLRHGETLDVAVILPELVNHFAALGRLLAVGVAARADEAALQARFGFRGYPTLVFLRGGDYLGAISGVLDWGPFLGEMARILDAPASRPPSIGIAVAGGGTPACH